MSERPVKLFQVLKNVCGRFCRGCGQQIRGSGDGERRAGPQAGFTIFEAFMVLMIIAILASVSAPVIVNTLKQQALQNGTHTLVNQFEFARVQAASRNRAYQVVVQLASGDNPGSVIVNEGSSPVCANATFDPLSGAAVKPMLKVREVLFTQRFENVILESVEPESLASTSLCFKPDGRVMRTDTGAPVTPAPEGYAAGEAVYMLRLTDSKGNPTDHTRRVVVSYNGIPKLE